MQEDYHSGERAHTDPLHHEIRRIVEEECFHTFTSPFSESAAYETIRKIDLFLDALEEKPVYVCYFFC